MSSNSDDIRNLAKVIKEERDEWFGSVDGDAIRKVVRESLDRNLRNFILNRLGFEASNYSGTYYNPHHTGAKNGNHFFGERGDNIILEKLAKFLDNVEISADYVNKIKENVERQTENRILSVLKTAAYSKGEQLAKKIIDDLEIGDPQTATVHLVAMIMEDSK